MVLVPKTNCLKNISQEWSKPEFLAMREGIFHFYHAYLALPPTVVAFVLTSLYIVGVMRAINEHRVSRKFYALLLNRAFGDLLGCVASAAIIVYILIVERSDNNIIQVINTLFTGCYWTSMVCYVSIGLLKLLGVAKPIHYRKYVTISRVKALIYASWVAFAVLVFVSMGITAMVKIPALSDRTGCTVEDCLMPVMRTRNLLIVCIYFLTILCFLVTAELVRRARRTAASFHRSGAGSGEEESRVREIQRRFRYPMIKLAVNVATFTVFNFPYSAWVLFWIFAPRCFFFSHVAITYSLMGVVRIILLMRIIVDCSLGLATDREVRRSLLTLYNSGLCRRPTIDSATTRRTMLSVLCSGGSGTATDSVSSELATDGSGGGGSRWLVAPNKATHNPLRASSARDRVVHHQLGPTAAHQHGSLRPKLSAEISSAQ